MTDYQRMVVYTYDIILLVAETYSYKLTLSSQLCSKKSLSKILKIVDNEKKKNYNNKSHHIVTEKLVFEN